MPLLPAVVRHVGIPFAVVPANIITVGHAQGWDTAVCSAFLLPAIYHHLRLSPFHENGVL